MPDFPNPSVEDIVLGFQFQATFDLPGKGTSHRITMGVLWHSELIDVSIATGRQIAQNDFASRTLLIQRETLVQAITQIDEWACYDQENQAHNQELKAHLRKLLGRASPVTIEYLWQCYDQLRQQQDRMFAERVDEIKKSTRPPEAPTELGVSPSDSESGETGGR